MFCFTGGRGWLLALQKIFVGVQHVVSKIFVDVAVESLGAGTQNGVDVAAAVAALAGVIEGGLDFEFLNNVGIREAERWWIARRCSRWS